MTRVRPPPRLARLYDLDLSGGSRRPRPVPRARRAGGRPGPGARRRGRGRLAVPLAEDGHEVTGVDLDPAMLARARGARRTPPGKAIARRLAARGGRRADRSACPTPATSASRSSRSTRSSSWAAARTRRPAVATLAAHLAPGGLAVVDAWLPDADDLARYDGRLVLEWVREDPETGPHR